MVPLWKALRLIIGAGIILMLLISFDSLDPRSSPGDLTGWMQRSGCSFKAMNHQSSIKQSINGDQKQSEEKFCPVNDLRVNITNLTVSQLSEETAVTGGYVLPIEEDFPREAEKTYCVPRKIHFVWIGEEIPDKYRKNIKTFVDLNPNYQIYLWTEKITAEVTESLPGVIIGDIYKEISSYTVKDLFDAEPNMGGKSDIIRYEVVYRNGGVYYDTDSICVKPLMDVLTHSFVSHNPGINSYQNIQNSVFGFPKDSRFLEFTLRILRWNIVKDPEAWIPVRTGPVFFSGCFVKYADPNIHLIKQHYIVLGLTDISLTYQTNDATWIEKERN